MYRCNARTLSLSQSRCCRVLSSLSLKSQVRVVFKSFKATMMSTIRPKPLAQRKLEYFRKCVCYTSNQLPTPKPKKSQRLFRPHQGHHVRILGSEAAVLTTNLFLCVCLFVFTVLKQTSDKGWLDAFILTVMIPVVHNNDIFSSFSVIAHCEWFFPVLNKGYLCLYALYLPNKRKNTISKM